LHIWYFLLSHLSSIHERLMRFMKLYFEL
jgi:hypothetical protein